MITLLAVWFFSINFSTALRIKPANKSVSSSLKQSKLSNRTSLLKQKALPTNLSAEPCGFNAPIPNIISSSYTIAKRQGIPPILANKAT